MKLTWSRQLLRLRHRFATAQGGVNEKETIVVRLEHEGVVGRGEVAPSRLYGQSLESSEAALAEMAGLLGNDPFRLETIVRRLVARCDGQRAAIAGIDNALHDWIGQRLGRPVWALLGLDPPRVRTTFTIGLAEPAEIREKVREAQADGYGALKVKVGSVHDHETLAIVRETFDGLLLLDANEAWQPDEAAGKMQALARFRPAMIEQPLAQDQWPHFAALRALKIAPLFADESCQRPADVIKLAGHVDGVNIKFTKCGGIREALRMITLARGLGMQVMIGCFVSSSLAIAPALAVATLADHADLDGHLLLANDTFDGLSRSGETIYLQDGPGLGVRPRATEQSRV